MRLECYGTSDELNSIVGVVRTSLEFMEKQAEESIQKEIDRSLEEFRAIQNDLFDLGSYLATPPDKPFDGMKTVTDERIEFLESSMDAMQKDLKPLKSFTLPGGHPVNAHCHHARTVCRRLERRLWQLVEKEEVQDNALMYINRLSDWFFVYSRWIMVRLDREEYLWDLKRD